VKNENENLARTVAADPYRPGTVAISWAETSFESGFGFIGFCNTRNGYILACQSMANMVGSYSVNGYAKMSKAELIARLGALESGLAMNRSRRRATTAFKLAETSARLRREMEERKKVESERMALAAIVEFSNDAIISRTLKGTIKTWNKGAEKLLGYSAKEAVGRPFSMLVPISRREELRDIERCIVRGEQVKHQNTVRLTKRRESIPMALTNSPLLDSNGKLIGISIIMRDISERVRGEEASQRSEKALADFFDHSPLGLFWVAKDGRVLRANEAGLVLLGTRSQECVDRNLSEFHADPEVAANLLELLAKRRVLHDLRARFRREDGSIRHVLIDANALWENARFVHSRWFVRDISGRVELEREILTVSEREQQRLGRELHDDLCQQLACAEFLIHSLEQELAAKSKTDARRAEEISKLLREANARTRELSHGLAPTHLEADGLFSALETLALRTRKVFRVDCRFRCAGPVQIDDTEVRHHLYRIAQEAVSNAVKHGRAKCIEIDLAASGSRQVLVVRDNGVGLSQKPRRAKGVGLRIMQYRAELICGSLVIQTKPNGGTAVACSINGDLAIPKDQKKK
jgi:two-component system sensor kinase FixL